MSTQPLSLGAIRRLHGGFRSLYLRVAIKHKVNASYVSKIVSGERRSPKIERALSDEVQRMLRK
jgi:hypothetical protein